VKEGEGVNNLKREQIEKKNSNVSLNVQLLLLFFVYVVDIKIFVKSNGFCLFKNKRHQEFLIVLLITILHSN